MNDKLHPGRRFAGVECAGAFELAVLLDPKDGEFAVLLSGGDEEFAIGCDIKRTRHGFGGGMADAFEFRAVVRVDGEGGDAVVAAIGDVDVIPAGMNFDVGGGFLSACVAFGWQ